MITHKQHQRGTDAARNGGVRAFMGGMRRLASVADDKAQNGHRPVSVREASHLSLPAGLTRFLPCQTGGGFTRSRLFSIRRCAWRAANTQFRFSDHLPCRDTDLLEAHVSQSVGFNANRHMRGNLEPCSPNRGIPLL